jgi:RNA polymerase sigma-70 factor (ECF subfamily)
MDSGESRALVHRLIGSHYEPLYRYARRLTGSAAQAEDFVQETFLVALERLDQLIEPDRAASWLRTTLRNLFLATLRREKRRSGGIDFDTVLAPSEPSRDDLLDLPQALGQLSEEFRVPLILFYVDHLGYREIADQLGLPIGTVMSRLSRAKAALKAHLEPDDAPIGSNG